MTTNEELWRVQLGTGELRVMTIDVLDEAFDAGIIDGSTLVLAPGASNWARLADVAGLEDAGAAGPAPTSDPAGAPSLSPVAISTSTDTPVSFAPAPLPIDLGDLSDDALRPKRGRAFLLGGIGVAAMAGLFIAFAVPKLGATLANVHPAKDMSNAMQPPPPAIDVTPNDGSFQRPQLTEEQKKLLAEADKKREEERKAKQQAAPAKGGKTAPRTKSSSPFVNGGDKFDPLNGAL